MNNLTERQVGYLAALVDGEETIGLGKQNIYSETIS